VPTFVTADDGIFYIEDVDFVNAFTETSFHYYSDNWVVSTAEALTDDGRKRRFDFSVTSATELYVGITFYNPRMYANGCKSN
jgi:hypothetical protein